jgi:hypothetical protein
MLLRRCLIAVAFLLLASPMFATTYYVCPNGNDLAPGTLPIFAWKTIAKVNQASLHSGDQVLFLWTARSFLYQLGTIKLVLRGAFDGTRQEAYGGADCEPAAAS